MLSKLCDLSCELCVCPQIYVLNLYGVELYIMYILLRSWHGAQGQGPVTDLFFCELVIKVDTYGDSSKSSNIYILIYHVTMKINKIPQLAMELQHERDGGMIP